MDSCDGSDWTSNFSFWIQKQQASPSEKIAIRKKGYFIFQPIDFQGQTDSFREG